MDIIKAACSIQPCARCRRPVNRPLNECEDKIDCEKYIKECTTFISKNIKIGIAGEDLRVGDSVIIKDGKLFRVRND